MALSFWPPLNPALLARVTDDRAAWRFPAYRRALLDGSLTTGNGRGQGTPLALLPPAAYIEWRYYAVLSPAFHGIVGTALVNPFGLAPRLAASGLLLILAGSFETLPLEPGTRPLLCWMYLFPPDALTFGSDSGTDAGTLHAEHGGVRLLMQQPSPAHGSLELASTAGLRLRLDHRGLAGTALAPCPATDLARTPGAHWTVYNPAPLAVVDGSITMPVGSLAALAAQGSTHAPRQVSPALAELNAAAPVAVTFAQASGYYEHSFGSNPLPLHSWDFCFAPDALNGQGLVLQTYARSRTLRYLDVFWRDTHGQPQRAHFGAEHLHLTWERSRWHPAIGARVPTRRRIEADNGRYVLRATNDIALHIPLLRPEHVMTRHYFIAEELGTASWQLHDHSGRLLAQAHEQRAGGEVSYARLARP